MSGRLPTLLLIAAGAATAPLAASESVREALSRAPQPLQCVPYARAVTGIRIYGDANTWWRQADGRFARGSRPKVGAVMNFRPHGNSRLGHVAAVSRIIDRRTVLISHANWSVPGGIERNVEAVDVSAANNWSRVRVWNGHTERLGGGEWPLYGFIYNAKPHKPASNVPDKRLKRAITPPKRYDNDPIGAIIAARS